MLDIYYINLRPFVHAGEFYRETGLNRLAFTRWKNNQVRNNPLFFPDIDYIDLHRRNDRFIMFLTLETATQLIIEGRHRGNKEKKIPKLIKLKKFLRTVPTRPPPIG